MIRSPSWARPAVAEPFSVCTSAAAIGVLSIVTAKPVSVALLPAPSLIVSE